MIFLNEHAPPGQRGYTSSWAGFSAQTGALLGSGVSALITASVTEEALHQWAWRIPFLLGSLIAVMGWYIRRRIPESPVFEEARRAGTLSSSPIRDVLTNQRRAILQVIGLVWLHGVAFYLLYVYLPTYLMTVTTAPRSSVLIMNTLCMALLAILIPFMGRLSDRIGHRSLLIVGAAGLALAAYPLFSWLASDRLPLMLCAQVLFTILVSCYMGPFFRSGGGTVPARTALYRALGRLQHLIGAVRGNGAVGGHPVNRMERSQTGAGYLFESCRPGLAQCRMDSSNKRAEITGFSAHPSCDISPSTGPITVHFPRSASFQEIIKNL